MELNEDDRAQRLLDVFPEVNGQINVSYVNSTSHVVAWHAHNIQTDHWTCLKGSFKVGLAFPLDRGGYEVKWEYLSDKNPRVLTIPPNVYHGYKALESNSILLYYLTEKYDPNDEFRMFVGDFNEEWETPNK
jgi:dTDP-4-dehydrorhamnose 3,5-epimerase-like enzyme